MKIKFGKFELESERSKYIKICKLRKIRLSEEMNREMCTYTMWKKHIDNLLDTIDEERREDFFHFVLNKKRKNKAMISAKDMVNAAFVGTVIGIVFSLPKMFEGIGNIDIKSIIQFVAIIVIAVFLIMGITLGYINNITEKNIFGNMFYEDLIKCMKNKKWPGIEDLLQ